MDLSFISSIILFNFGPILLQFGAEKAGREAPVRSLLSLLTVCLVDGGSRGRRLYSSCHGGGEGWAVGWHLPVTTGIGRWVVLTSLSSVRMDVRESQQELFLEVTILEIAASCALAKLVSISFTKPPLFRRNRLTGSGNPHLKVR